jgi:hypothetical protein
MVVIRSSGLKAHSDGVIEAIVGKAARQGRLRPAGQQADHLIIGGAGAFPVRAGQLTQQHPDLHGIGKLVFWNVYRHLAAQRLGAVGRRTPAGCPGCRVCVPWPVICSRLPLL